MTVDRRGQRTPCTGSRPLAPSDVARFRNWRPQRNGSDQCPSEKLQNRSPPRSHPQVPVSQLNRVFGDDQYLFGEATTEDCTLFYFSDFNGFNQVCFFEPLLPILTSSSYFGLQDYGFDGDAMDQSGELASADTVSLTAATNTESENPPSMPPASASPPSGFRGKGLDPRFFLLILKNGSEQVVTDYWVAAGYIEYVSRDGSRSHIPVEALDLQATVTENSYRGLPFSLRSIPQQN